jgi:hypothetical protein
MAKSITWIVDSSIAERLVYHRSIVDEIRSQGHKCIEVSYKVGEDLPVIESHGCTILYGSHQFVKAVNPTGRFQPGHLGVNDRTKMSSYMSNLPLDWFMNKDARFMTWAMFKNYGRAYFENQTEQKSLFIRPDSGFKTFAGQTIKFDEWDESVKTLDQLSSVMPETLILVAPISQIQGEFRFVIADKQVVAGSEYRWDGKLDIRRDWPEECFTLAEKVASQEWQVDIAYTCDVALTDEGPKIVELNGFSCAGLYACDISKVVEGVSRAAYREWAGLDLL